jgi:RHS repeat-associated protein
VRLKVKYGYSRGYLASIRDFTGDVDGTVYWSQAATDPWFNAIDESYGNGLRVISGFSPITGLIDYRQSGTGGSTTNVQNLGYTWDKALNLTQRQDSRQGLTEAFTYDALNRLDYSTLNGTINLDVTLDLIGNVTYRSDVGSYTYHATRKHAVTAAGGNTYTYDANGNVATRNGSSIVWSSYNLPLTINGNGQAAQLAYAPDRSRWRQISSYAGGSETTIYVGEALEKMTASASNIVRWRHLISTPGANVQVTRRSDGTNEVLYVAKDHLGSTDALLNASGTVLARASFAAYGGRRGTAWTGAPTTAEMQAYADQTRRGYTEHEMLDNVGLIHMNGRVYDPGVGRFLSADPIADGLGEAGGFNRYAYVSNRPLSLTDPSGFSGNNQCLLGRCELKEVTVTDKREYNQDRYLERLREANIDLFFDRLDRGGFGGYANVRETDDGVEVTATREKTSDGATDARRVLDELQRRSNTRPQTLRMPSEFGKCYGPPAAPTTGKSRSELMRIARENGARAAKQPLSLAGLLWFRNQVRNGGPWDYKQLNPGYQDFGNYNYGYAGTAMGLGSGVLLRQAGLAQIAAGTSRPEWGDPGTFGAFGGKAPYGDDPVDQVYIAHGISDRTDGC